MATGKSFLDWDDRMRARALYLEFFTGHYRTVITTSMMMSQTAFDAQAVLETTCWRSYVTLDFVIFDIMAGVMKRIVKRGNYHHVSIFLDFLRRGLDSDSRYSQIATVLRGERAVERMYKNETCDGVLPSQHSQHAFTVAVAAVLHLLAFVFQYLIGYIDRGGTKTYSSGCFDFRASFVSVLLFLAAFVWIKFRQAARPPTGKRKQPEHPVDDADDRSHIFLRKYGSVTKYEARYTIPVSIRDEAHPVKRPRLTLGEYKLPEVAAFVWRVAKTCYEDHRGTCCVTLQGEPYTFPVPAMSEQERGLVGEEKRQWVIDHAKDVGKNEYEKYAKQFSTLSTTSTGSHDRSPSRRTCQPSLMLARSCAYSELGMNGNFEAPSCSVPHQPRNVESTVGEELSNPGSQSIQEQHEGRTQNPQPGRVISESEVVSTPCECMLPKSPVMFYDINEVLAVACDHHPKPPEGGTIDGDKTYSEFATIPEMPLSGAEAVEQGSEPQFGPLQKHFQQRMCAGYPVQQSVAFESVVGEQSESEHLETIVQQQLPQACGEEFLDLEYQQVFESQNPGLQQVYTPSQQISDHLVEKDDPYEINSKLIETCSKQSQDNQCLLVLTDRLSKENERLRKENERLRKEKELADQETKSWRDKYEGLGKEIETFYALARKLM